MFALALAVVCLCAAASAESQDRYLERGNELIGRQDYGAAERVFREALAGDPDNRLYRAQLGLCLLRPKRHADADRELEWVLARYPNDVPASWYLALNRYFEGRYREAAARFRSILPHFGERAGQYSSAHWFIASSWRAVLFLKSPADVPGAVARPGAVGTGLTYDEVNEMVDAYRKYLDLQPQAPDRVDIERFLAWVAKNRPPANAGRWHVVNEP